MQQKVNAMVNYIFFHTGCKEAFFVVPSTYQLTCSLNDTVKIFAGSGRVTFCNRKSYMRAVQAAFIEIKTPKFTKKVGLSLSIFLSKHFRS